MLLRNPREWSLNQSFPQEAASRETQRLEISAYLDRIGFDHEPLPDRRTLDELQHHHLHAIPYENLDVLLGRKVVLDPAAAFDKLVKRRRGGWCYEMNGLFGWALGELGFYVTRLASGVMRPVIGDAAVGNHLVLRVDFESGSALGDVGLGEGPLRAFDIVEGPFEAGGCDYRLEGLGAGWWRLHNREGANPPNFDFRADLTDEALLSRMCVSLQTDPASIFVQNLICQRFVPGGHLSLLGRTLRRKTAEESTERLLASADELVDVLTNEFGIDEPGAVEVWPRICDRHAELFG
jgi:N-hydroxyarylamine O-acetyltransferase